MLLLNRNLGNAKRCPNCGLYSRDGILEGDTSQGQKQKIMNRNLFMGILGIIGLMVLASSLPNKFYGANDRKFIVVTVITSIVAAIGLVIFFSTPFLAH